MADIEVRFDFPTAAAPTVSFVPSLNPQFPDEAQHTLAVASDKTAGNQRYDYYKGYSERVFILKFRFLTSADKSAFENFVDAVLGGDFQFTDFQGAVHTVRFAEKQFQWKYVFDQSLRYSWTVELREALVP
jgi:hypothetical protein